ncbi:unnamed protein product, partial [Cylicostephanus goldi]
GLRKALPVPVTEDVATADKTVVEVSCISTLPLQFGGKKRSANAAFGEQKPTKVRKTEVILPKQIVVKESLFKFDNVAMVPHHSVGDGQLLATTAKHHPIHLWNEEGSRISSYRGINHLDELTAAYSIAFSNDGAQLYAGYDACIRIWNCDRPGRQHTTIQTWGTVLLLY